MKLYSIKCEINVIVLVIIYFIPCIFCVEDENLEMDSDIPVVEGFGETITISEDEDVLVLTKENFHHIVGTKEVILVEFYAPWCGHCKTLEPEYASAAKVLKHDGIRIAKVDATAEEDLAKEFEITGFPTLKLFRKGQVVEDFDGTRTSSGIIEYMKKHADPNYKPPPSAIKVLTSSNFSDFVNSEKLSLVEFYAPWCGHCKKLAPEYEAAAMDLVKDKILLAKVDAMEEKSLAAQYDVKGYPKLLVFRAGRAFEFKGPRERDGICRYMRDEAPLPSARVDSLLEAKSMVAAKKEALVFAYFEGENDMYAEYIAAANGMRGDLNFVHTFDASIAHKYGLGSNSVNIICPDMFTSKYEDKQPSFNKFSGSESEMRGWVREAAVPLVGHRTRANLATHYATRRPLLVVYYDVNFDHQHIIGTQFVRRKMLPVASQHRDLTFAVSSEDEFQDDMKSVGLEDSGEDVNAIIFGDQNLKFRMEPQEEFDSQVLEELVLKYKKNKLKPYLKSQPIPKRQEGPVRMIVAETFEKEVLESEADVLLQFYAPWCGHCQKIEPVYKKVAKHFAGERPTLVVAKMDAVANDVHPDVAVSGFPTFYLFKAAGEKRKPVLFEGADRTFKGFKARERSGSSFHWLCLGGRGMKIRDWNNFTIKQHFDKFRL